MKTLRKRSRKILDLEMENARLRGAMTDAIFEIEENYFQRASAVLTEALKFPNGTKTTTETETPQNNPERENQEDIT